MDCILNRLSESLEVGLLFPRSFIDENMDFSDELLLGLKRSLFRLKSAALLEVSFGDTDGLDPDFSGTPGSCLLLLLELLPNGLLEPELLTLPGM